MIDAHREPSSTSNQKERANRFQALHNQSSPFVIANPWDGGSARILFKLGFQALATSSAASAAALGRLDGDLKRGEALKHAFAIVNATACPVSADLENGFGHQPLVVAETVRLAAAAGLVGCSIDDATGDQSQPLYPIALAAERISAAAEAARALPFPFTLTARAEGLGLGNQTLAETIHRLHVFEQAGADVLFAPDLPDLNAVREVCASVSKPVNFMVGLRGRSFSIAELAEAGVRRISLSWSLYRAAMSGLLNAANEIQATGTFKYVESAVTSAVLSQLLR